MNKEIPVPRIQGSAFQRPTDKWVYEIVISYGSEEPIIMGLKEDHEGYETKDEALVVIKEIAQFVAGEFCKRLGVEQDGFYDLTKNMHVKDL